jgi:glycosyltransferase involved in cell wall biosynthesis
LSSRRVTIVASELLGGPDTGGAGTADSLLAVALGRHGHDVELLIASGRPIGSINDRWRDIYASAGVHIRRVDSMPGVRPRFLAPPFEIFHALRERPPDVVIADDWRGLAYAALRARETRLAFDKAAFVLYCHGPGRVLSAFAQKVPDTFDRFGEQIAERAALQLADAVVSPTQWLLDWMRDHGWPVPASATVIQLLRESTVLGTTPKDRPGDGEITRVAFFGKLREGKGIRIFLEALNELEPSALDGVEVLFLGGESKRWPPHRIVASVPPGLRASVRIKTNLPREDALDELQRPGTLAVMPSLLDNSPNTVLECLEYGVPFVAAATGGIPELISAADRGRVLFPPTARDAASALRRALDGSGFAPARPAHEPSESLRAWLELVETVEPRVPKSGRRAARVAVVAEGESSSRRAQKLAAETKTVDVDMSGEVNAEWVVFLDDEDHPDATLVDTLVGAQAACGADVVTAAVRSATDPASLQLFLGDPGPLGLAENQYGVLALVRASLLADVRSPREGVDRDWRMLARLALDGARIVSLPEALSTLHGRPGRVGDVPGDGLAVLETFEQHAGEPSRDLPQFAATLAASLSLAGRASEPSAPSRRAIDRIRSLARRALHRNARAVVDAVEQ